MYRYISDWFCIVRRQIVETTKRTFHFKYFTTDLKYFIDETRPENNIKNKIYITKFEHFLSVCRIIGY